LSHICTQSNIVDVPVIKAGRMILGSYPGGNPTGAARFPGRPYINAKIFLEYDRNVFLSCLVCVRGLGAFTAEEAGLLMDNCSAHVTDDVIRLLTDATMRVITFAPHTTHIFLVVDLTLFGALKRRPRYELPFETDHATVKFMMKVYHDFRQTMVPSNVWGAFHALGLDYDTRKEPSRLLFDEGKLKGRACIQEL
jgi:hypothetical protein